MSERLRHLVRGSLSNLKFSNRLWLTYNRLFRRNARAISYIWKNRLYIVCDCSRGDHQSVQEIFAERAYDPLLSIALGQSNDIRYVNVGANIGAFDLMLFDRGIRIKSGVAVELNPRTFQRCQLNLETNAVPNVKIVNCGVANRDSYLDFFPSQISLGDNIFEGSNSEKSTLGTPQKIELISLETLLSRYVEGTESIDLLKLDCEGAEYLILKSTPEQVLKRFRSLIIEFHPEPPGESITEAYQKLATAGFSSHQGGPRTGRYVEVFTRR